MSDGKLENSNGKYSTTRYIKDKQKIFNFTAPIYSFLGGSVVPGQFNFPFKILLPHDIPSSCFYTNNSTSKAHGKVKYKLKATLKSNKPDLKDMTYKQILIIRQQPVEMPISSKADYVDQVNSCCCCCSNGIVKIESQTDKTAYTPIETAKIMTSIDNSLCTKEVRNIKVQLIQNIHLHAQRMKRNMLLDAIEFDSSMYNIGSSESQTEFTHSQVILEKEYPGIGKGEKTDGMERFMELPLGEYNSKPDEDKYSSDFDEQDDQALASGVQPTCVGKLIQITYTLKIVPDYNTCCVCSSPGTAIGLFISPPKLPSYKKLEAPPNWDPQVFESKNFADPVPTFIDE